MFCILHENLKRKFINSISTLFFYSFVSLSSFMTRNPECPLSSFVNPGSQPASPHSIAVCFDPDVGKSISRQKIQQTLAFDVVPFENKKTTEMPSSPSFSNSCSRNQQNRLRLIKKQLRRI